MRYSFKTHYDRKVFSLHYDGTHYYINLGEFPQYETFVNFNTWKSMYAADKQNWSIYHENTGKNTAIIMPFYCDQKHKLHFIKFLTRRDYRRFRRFWKKEIANGETYENLKEQEELVTIIRERANQNLKDALKKQAKAEEKVRQQAEKMLEDQKRKDAVKETMNKPFWHMTGNLYYDHQNGTYIRMSDTDSDLLTIASKPQHSAKKKPSDLYYDPVSQKLYVMTEDKQFKEVKMGELPR